MPLVTVLMPVYNAGCFLKQSIDSILCQTHGDFDFVIVDDGSTDIDTRRILQEALSDNRVRLLTHPKRMGVARSLNHGLDAATGEFIARMDADDISHPQRLEKQVEFMRMHPEVGLCGTAVECFGRVEGLRIINPVDPEEIKCRLLLSCPISHPTVMFRTASLQRYQLRYDEEFETGEDYELWIRCAMCFPIANLLEPLLYYRIHTAQDERNPARPVFLKKIIMALWNALDLSYSEEEVEGFFQLAHYPDPESAAKRDKLISRVETVFSRILRTNDSQKKYDPEILKKTLSWFWMTTLAGERRYSWSVWRRYQRNAYSPPSLSARMRLLVKCLIHWEARDPRRLLHS
jgi:glycosyltransferase involved in cell wall biosynthesis